MSKKWLVAVDDSKWAEFAFNYAIEFICPKVDHLYLLHVKDQPMRFASWDAHRDLQIVEGVEKAEDHRSRKILSHYA